MDPSSAYREASAQSGNPVHLVVLAYEQLVRDLRRALTAWQDHDIEKRTHEIDHALVVLAQLQGTLDMELGGEVARNLERFYNGLRASLLQAQIDGATDILQKQIANILSLREAWLEVERATSPAGPHTPIASPAAGGRTANPEEISSDWRG
ncbi:MAG TPA: flagellar export chaperone FliS [Terriglobales bacterium]|nr:flagellar export chaperone FliS [Terriglobales bacterium]